MSAYTSVNDADAKYTAIEQELTTDTTVNTTTVNGTKIVPLIAFGCFALLFVGLTLTIILSSVCTDQSIIICIILTQLIVHCWYSQFKNTERVSSTH